MKKFIVCLAAVFAMTVFVACGGAENDNATVNLNNNDNIQNEGDEQSVLDGETFEKLPDEAVDSFNYVAEAVKELFDDEGGSWMYGYKGMGTIEGSPCYIFAIYSYKDEVHTKLGTVATSVDSNDLYVLDETTGEYVKAQLSDDSTEELSWAETETLAFVNN